MYLQIWTMWWDTVKPAVAATSIKRDPPLSGHFRAPPPQTILNANAPSLSVHQSNEASGPRNLPPNTEIVSLNGKCVKIYRKCKVILFAGGIYTSQKF